MKNITIYQINSERDINRLKFEGTKMIKALNKEFDFSIYNKVWSGKVDCKTLHEVYEMFNINHPSDFKGHSLSVSDLVVWQDDNEPYPSVYFCDRFGWTNVKELL